MRPVAIVLCLAACAPDAAVVPRGGLPRAMATAGPITMTAFAEQWSGAPEDLLEYITPIAVELYNAGPSEVRVSYADFALRDERGFRYAAINPFVPARYGRIENPRDLLAARGGGGGGHSSGGGHGAFGNHSSGGSGHSIVVGPPSGHRYGSAPGVVGSHGGWSGYQIYGGLGGYYGSGWLYWGGPFVYPPWYSTWVFFWGPRYYPSDRPSADVIDLALPEGVLEPGGHVNGFLYFQKATDRARTLDLSWEAREARSGNFVSLARVPLEVVER